MSIFAPVQRFADLATYGWLGIAEGSYAGDGVNFFIYGLNACARSGG